MEIQNLTREFNYNGVRLADPSPTLTLAQVRDFYSNVYPEIISADIEGPKNVGANAIYTFRRAVGTKGRVTMRHLLADLAALAPAGKLSAPDLDHVRMLQELARTGAALSTCHAMLLSELHRRYLPGRAS